ncbi:MAG: Sir2 silent information regulator family NAD-dependent deacetylase [Eubacteriales bacterium]|nr:Sir2 silent information regulator family NAD-dependent deacetylase [Eubacteriales bacterium]
MFSKIWMNRSTESSSNNIESLTDALKAADAVVIGAGAGLSTSAGYVYTGERFNKYFSDFAEKYGFRDMYSGGFYPYHTPEENWAFWSRYIYINRYTPTPKPVYEKLLDLVKSKDYFVLTTNVDHCFQKAGFDKQRLFYTQGDYSLWQCSEPCHDKTYDNEETVRKMILAQGYEIEEDGTLVIPEGTEIKMTVPTKLIPRCPVCGKPMRMNLRADDTFVQDDGWYAAAVRYGDFLARHGIKASGFWSDRGEQKRNHDYNGKVLFLELGCGMNTPGIIKVPFWQMTNENRHATYACINYGEAMAPKEIEKRSICINGDIGQVLSQM